MDHFAQWVLGLLMILGGLGYSGLRVLADFDGDPDEGFLGGWGPVGIGVIVAVLGVCVIAF